MSIATAATTTSLKLTALPASPAEIPADASTEFLKAVRDAWLNQAIEDGLAWALWRTASALGAKKRRYARDYREFYWNAPAGPARLSLGQSAIGYRPGCGCFYTRTTVVAYVDGEIVANIVWEHPEKEDPQAEHIVKKDSLFVPGRWTEALPRFTARAIEVVNRKAQEEAEAERKQLLHRLLAGKIV